MELLIALKLVLLGWMPPLAPDERRLTAFDEDTLLATPARDRSGWGDLTVRDLNIGCLMK